MTEEKNEWKLPVDLCPAEMMKSIRNRDANLHQNFLLNLLTDIKEKRYFPYTIKVRQQDFKIGVCDLVKWCVQELKKVGYIAYDITEVDALGLYTQLFIDVKKSQSCSSTFSMNSSATA